MHASSDYTVSLKGKASDIEAATTILAETFFDDDMIGMDCIEIEETYEVVWVEDIILLAESMIKAAPELESIVISGTVDTSESAGEYMDFVIKYENGTLTAQSSCWYLIMDADDFDDYEDFCDAYGDRYTEEEFMEMRGAARYILDSGDGDVVTEVPFDEPEVIDLDATVVYISKDIASQPPVPVCTCECGAQICLNNRQEELFVLFVGANIPTQCEKCGKKYKVYID